MAPITRGLMKAKIRRQDVLEVIKPRDHVFLGHQIPDCQVSANLREEIVRRAVKCTEKPSLVFDYHYRCVNWTLWFLFLILTFRTNCESFCNMILFDIPHSTQAPQTIRCLRGVAKVFSRLHVFFLVRHNQPYVVAGLFNCLQGLLGCCKESESLEDQLEKRLRGDEKWEKLSAILLKC